MTDHDETKSNQPRKPRDDFWIAISDITGMPISVQRCTFKPTINPKNTTWFQFQEVMPQAEGEK